MARDSPPAVFIKWIRTVWFLKMIMITKKIMTTKLTHSELSV